MKTITYFHPITEVNIGEDRSAAMPRLCRKLRNMGIPIYYSKELEDIVVQHGTLSFVPVFDPEGWNFVWEEDCENNAQQS